MEENGLLPIDTADSGMSAEEIETRIRRLPAEISERSERLARLHDKVKDAEAAARAADTEAQAMNGYSDKKFLMIKIKSGSTKEIVEEILKVTKKSSEAIRMNAEALRLTGEFQQELARTCEFLFYLGCYNIAANESMIASLNSQLKGESDATILSAEVKEQYRNVVRRLKAQQDVLCRQQRLEDAVRESRLAIRNLTLQQQAAEQKLNMAELSTRKLKSQYSSVRIWLIICGLLTLSALCAAIFL